MFKGGDLLVGRDVSGFEMGFPVGVCTTITPFLDRLRGGERRYRLNSGQAGVPPSVRGSTCRDRWT